MDEEFVRVCVGRIDKSALRKFVLELGETLGAKHRFNRAQIRPLTGDVRRAPGPGQHFEGTENDRLAGSGFPREHVQARIKFELSLFDDLDLANAQGFDQRSPQLSLVWRISKRLRNGDETMWTL